MASTHGQRMSRQKFPRLLWSKFAERARQHPQNRTSRSEGRCQNEATQHLGLRKGRTVFGTLPKVQNQHGMLAMHTCAKCRTSLQHVTTRRQQAYKKCTTSIRTITDKTRTCVRQTSDKCQPSVQPLFNKSPRMVQQVSRMSSRRLGQV